MIVLIWLQLFIGTIITLMLLGNLLNIIQRIVNPNPHNFSVFLVATIPIIVFVYGLIAYYYSKVIDLYFLENGDSKFVTIVTFGLLAFLLYGPAKYSETQEEKGQIRISVIIPLILFCIWRFYPHFIENLYSWVPIYIWR